MSVLCSLVLTSSNHTSVLFICCTLVDRSPILCDLLCFSFLKELSFHLLVIKKRKGRHSEKTEVSSLICIAAYDVFLGAGSNVGVTAVKAIIVSHP